KYYEQQQKEISNESPTPEVPDAVDVEEGENPFAATLKNDDETVSDLAGSGNDTIIVEDNTFVFENSGVSLEPLKAKKVKEAVDIECTVEESTDFCFAGHVSFEEEKTIDVFAVENMT